MAEKEDEFQAISQSIREIPFRILANKYSLDEDDFIEGVYKTKLYANFFLNEECQRKFQNKIAQHVDYDPRYLQLRKMKRERKPFKSKETYSDVLANRTVTNQIETIKDDKTQDIYSIEYLENISPSALSKDFIEYSTVDFNITAPKNERFGEAFETIVEVFLNTITVDELLMCLMVLYSSNDPHFLKDQIHTLRVYKHFLEEKEKMSFSLNSLTSPSSQISNLSSYISRTVLTPETIAYYSAFPELTFPEKSDD